MLRVIYFALIPAKSSGVPFGVNMWCWSLHKEERPG